MKRKKNSKINKSRSFLSILVPSATVFFSSACIMVLELVAGRLIARNLGSSLYTWTSVIGVVLAGITIGNYLGGRIADRFHARKALATLFAISSAACVVTVILNNLVGEWMWLWQLSWPMRTFTHVSLVFLLPSTLLGTISPVVAKMALERGLPTGRTVGDIYAWGAAGSIAGTFAAGFYLIATMGTIAIIWTVGASLLLMAILYWVRFWPLYVWAAIFIALMTMGMVPADWARSTGSSLALREKVDPAILYQDETQYCHVVVRRLSEKPDTRFFMQDKLVHSRIIMGEIENLQYPYAQIHAAITHRFSGNKKKLSVLVIGGGGYVFPQYVEKLWPGSRIDVVEIDPGVTEAAIEAFGLKRDTTINTINMDARNYVDELLEKKRTGQQIPRYDFIYEDAINDYSVPYQLVTREFNDKIAQILAADGVYMTEIVDIYDSGLFLGAYVNTLQETFPHVYVITTKDIQHSERNIFVIVAAKRELDLDNLAQDYKRKQLELWHLNESEVAQLKTRAGNLIMTDDYAPVENLLAPVVRKSGLGFSTFAYSYQARKLSKEGKFEESLRKYESLVETNPTASAYNEMALILAKQGKHTEAIEKLRKALEADKEREITASIHYNLGLLLKKIGKSQEAAAQFDEAAGYYREQLVKKPDSVETYVQLGDCLARNTNFKGASESYAKAVALNPLDPANRTRLALSFELQGRIDEAIVVLEKGFELMSENNQADSARKFKEYIEFLKNKKSQIRK